MDMDDNMEYILLLDEELAPAITEDEAEQLKPIQKQFIESYLRHKDTMPIEDWLKSEMSASLPDRSPEEISEMSHEILETLKIQEEKKQSLQEARAQGRSKEAWFASEMKKAASFMSGQEAAKYLTGLDEAVQSANEALFQTIHTKAGLVSQNPNLDGFIAEQYHAQTFNMNAKATGSSFYAEVLEPKGTTYTKNSVDIVIKDADGKIVKRYQSKYCKDPKATADAFNHGDYRGQQKLVPKGQKAEISKKCTTVIASDDGTTSNPLTKEQAKDFQETAQKGYEVGLDWNEYRLKDVARGIGKKSLRSGLAGAAMGGGTYLVQKVWTGEEIDGIELAEETMKGGAEFGLKAAAAGAIKVGVEKGIIKAIPKGTPADIIADIVQVGVEDAKIAKKVATGELTVKEGLDRIEQTTMATIVGIVASNDGTLIGAAIGQVFGPPGVMVGAFVGGSIGFMAGSKVGQAVIKGAQKIRDFAVNKVREAFAAVKAGTHKVFEKALGLSF